MRFSLRLGGQSCVKDKIMADSDGKMAQEREVLNTIVGERLLGTRTFCATRHFYFGKVASQMEPAGSAFTIGLECPWRIRTPGGIIVGSEDYYERADGNDDPAWEAGSPAGHLQDQLLAKLLGTLRDGDVINTGPGFLVESVDVDDYGGFRIMMTDNVALEAMPTSTHIMEWIFISPGRGSLVLLNGTLHRTPAGGDMPPS
jgi:hypothetical protein